MAEPGNHTLRLLWEIRSTMDRNHEDLTARIGSLRQAKLGESILGRYTTAEFEQRISDLEKRVAALEGRG
jgi:hypothetical protein